MNFNNEQVKFFVLRLRKPFGAEFAANKLCFRLSPPSPPLQKKCIQKLFFSISVQINLGGVVQVGLVAHSLGVALPTLSLYQLWNVKNDFSKIEFRFQFFHIFC